MKYKVMSLAVAAAFGGWASTAALPAAAEEAHHAGAPRQVAEADTLADGEIRKVDKDARKLTIKHGPIANLDMPAMTMVFQVKDPALLDQVKAGDKVRFAADKVGGAYVVTRFEPSR
jgi:Cu/Ag efflux protein CusF